MSLTSTFTLQRIHEIQNENSELNLGRDIELAKEEFPIVLDIRADSLMGRGHHESYHLFKATNQVICFLWDEDHDERLYIAASKILNSLSDNAKGLILIFGERKASLTIVTSNENAKKSLLLNIPNDIDVGHDVWNISITTPTEKDLDFSGIVNEHTNSVFNYISNLLATREALEQVAKNLMLREMEVKVRQLKISSRKI